MTMTQKTAERLTTELVNEVESHPHRDEIFALMMEQLVEMELDGYRD